MNRIRSKVWPSPEISSHLKKTLLTEFLTLAMLSTAEATSFGTVEVFPDNSATSEEVAVVRKALTIANDVKNSDCFREFMGTRKLVDTNDRAPEQVAAHLQSISGAVPVSFYFRCLGGSSGCISPTSAIAYRQPPGPTVYLNRAYYDVSRADFDIYELAGSLAHEAIGHSLGGYDHSFEWTPNRDFSVPYSISGASSENDDAFQHCRQTLGYR